MSIQARRPSITIKLREAMERYRTRFHARVTYASLAEQTGLSRATIESMATRRGYNPSLRTIARICSVLRCTPGELLDLAEEGKTPAGKAGRR